MICSAVICNAVICSAGICSAGRIVSVLQVFLYTLSTVPHINCLFYLFIYFFWGGVFCCGPLFYGSGDIVH